MNSPIELPFPGSDPVWRTRGGLGKIAEAPALSRMSELAAALEAAPTQMARLAAGADETPPPEKPPQRKTNPRNPLKWGTTEDGKCGV